MRRLIIDGAFADDLRPVDAEGSGSHPQFMVLNEAASMHVRGILIPEREHSDRTLENFSMPTLAESTHGDSAEDTSISFGSAIQYEPMFTSEGGKPRP
jgi:hypothetical protein